MPPPAVPDFLGRGWAFPPSFSKLPPFVTMVRDLEDIRQSLRVLMATTPGERIMVPGYGCDLWRFVFQTVTTSLTTEMADVVNMAIIRWEPRIDPISVTVTENPDTTGLVLIEIVFDVRATNTRSNLVYPFYLTEATLAGGS
jgi:phage baseplate assembly protein W